jgi:hypothetical protein
VRGLDCSEIMRIKAQVPTLARSRKLWDDAHRVREEYHQTVEHTHHLLARSWEVMGRAADRRIR